MQNFSFCGAGCSFWVKKRQFIDTFRKWVGAAGGHQAPSPRVSTESTSLHCEWNDDEMMKWWWNESKFWVFKCHLPRCLPFFSPKLYQKIIKHLLNFQCDIYNKSSILLSLYDRHILVLGNIPHTPDQIWGMKTPMFLWVIPARFYNPVLLRCSSWARGGWRWAILK